MIGGIQNIARIPELRARILFTFGMLAVYRVGCAVVTPGINTNVIRDFFEQMSGTAFGMFNLFSGGALQQMSIFSLGIMPYISATIIFQLLTVVIPQLEQLKKEGEQGQKKINQWSRYATIVLALFQGMLIATALENGQFGQGAVMNPGWGFRLMTMITLTTGTAFIMWLGEQVTERGIGNGISLVIFSSIVVAIPSGMFQMFDLIQTDQFSPLQAIFLLGFMLALIAGVVFVERAQRRIPIQHARRVVGKRVTQGGMSYFPLRVNTAGVIPPIFASSLLMIPSTLRQFTESPELQQAIDQYMNPGGFQYNLVYMGLIIFFCFFYTSIMINPVDVSENIKRFGGYIPGIRPGANTADHIDKVLSRLTFVGAVYVAVICIVPVILAGRMNIPFYFGGTALLICVGVSLDTIGQIEAHLVSREYDGFVKGGRVRGRLGR
ncbi:MAG TPA: preprotein translocase subunit SecY [Myxococcales bacterium]|nr:preprotein translocase subunit SecY [Myxococcales bacterium]HIM01887.1 preprotein translocase subunit SecY [Myxococcales bacterium]